MRVGRGARQKEAQLAFEALSIEGGLLSHDWLSRAAQLLAGGQAEADYRVPKGLNLRDEIGRYWRIAQAHWGEFAAGQLGGGEPRALAERFVLALLRESFGFVSLVRVEPSEIADRIYPIGFAALGGRVPVVVAPVPLAAKETDLDTPDPFFGDGGRRRSAFGLAQELLNAADGMMWGLACNGLSLRILRDNASLTRPAWIEADLARIFTEQRYADFAALWLLAHETRFGWPEQAVTECALETWRTAGREEGTRAREYLRRGVEEALVALGSGFLSHPENGGLRASLQDGSVSTTAYFQQLLRLVYRLIFLLTVEERGLLHPEASSETARRIYAEGYSLKHLRDRSVRRSAHDRFSDIWEATKVVFRGLGAGESRLALPALAGIFARSHCPELDSAKLENRALLLALFRLSWLREASGLARVNWRDMGPEELGSVYESLLELVPQIVRGGRAFAFATGGETKGNARKTTGSYYTPDSLVQALLDSALEPVVRDTISANPGRQVEALLDLAVVDPACGSGHFLLSASRRLAAHVARLATNGTPSAAEYRHALRQVVGRCIFGVDLNPMAVELCKVSLWMEAVEPGRPLSFLDSHIQHGNALFGATSELLSKGIPDAAWEPLEGDDKKTARALKTQNRLDAKAIPLEFNVSPASTYARLGAGALAVDDAADESLAGIESKERRWAELVASTPYHQMRFIADTWCAAFVWRKEQGPLREAAPTDATFRAMQRDGVGGASTGLREEVERLRLQYRFFHWDLAFPQVLARGGFNVVVGNPPWERVKLQEQEFFASRSDEIANASNAASRKKLIAALPDTNQALWSDWCRASREAEGLSHFVRQSGRYPLCGRGDVNTYALFAEHNRAMLGPTGRAGFIVPTGIATDDTTKDYFGALVEARSLSSFYSFENEAKVFPSVHNQFKFALLTIDRSGKSERSDLFFFARQVTALADKDRHFSLAAADFAVLNPNTRTCPTFRSRRDADLNLGMYQRVGVLVREADEKAGNPWSLEIRTRTWHMAEDAALFRTKAELVADSWTLSGSLFTKGPDTCVPLIEAKMVHHFDHRFGTYENATQANLNKGTLPRLDAAAHASPEHLGLPEYWVRATEMDERLREHWTRGWLLGWRDIARSVDERTLIASLIPRAATGNTFLLAMPAVEPRLIAALYANMCSFVLDYATRQKVGGTHLTYHTFKQLPVLSPATYLTETQWSQGTILLDWLLTRVLELTFTAWDLEPFARDVGYAGAPFRWDPERRFLLRAEIDAAFCHLYGLSRDDAAFVLDSFPIVSKSDQKAHSEYRTKRVILEIYDAMTEATRAHEQYVTRLDPPAADPGVAHPSRVGVLTLPVMPSFVPTLEPGEELARCIWAVLHASDGAVRRMDLARALSLRSQPGVLVKLASGELAAVARAWVEKVGTRTVAPGALAAVLKGLEDRGGVRFAVEGSHSIVGVSSHTPSADLVDPWSHFEARLALMVLANLGPQELPGVDSTIVGDDHALLSTGTA